MDAEQAYLFSHAVLRDAAYQLQLPGDRARLHAFSFAILEPAETTSPDFSVELANHAEAGCGFDPSLAGAVKKWLTRAANLAEEQYAHAPAATTWRRLTNLAVDGEEVISARLNEGRNLMHAGKCAQAEGVLRECLEAPDATDRMKLLAAANLASNKMMQQRFAEARAGFAELRARHGDSLEPRMRCVLLVNEALACKETGDFALAERLAMEAMTMARQLGEPRLVTTLRINMANLYRELHRVEESLAILREEYQAAREASSATWTIVAGVNLAWCQLHLGEFEQPREITEQLIPLLKEASQQARYGIEYLLSYMASHTGDDKAVKFHSLRALELALELGQIRDAARSYHTVIAASFDDPVASNHYLEQFHNLAAKSGDAKVLERYHCICGNVHARRNEFAEAVDNHLKAWQFARQMNDRYGESLNRGNAGLNSVPIRRPDAKAFLEEAQQVAAAAGNRHQEAWWQLGLAVCEALEGNVDKADERCRHARQRLCESSAPEAMAKDQREFADYIRKVAAALQVNLDPLLNQFSERG